MTKLQPLANVVVSRHARIVDKGIRLGWSMLGSVMLGDRLATRLLSSSSDVRQGLVLSTHREGLLGVVASNRISLRLHDWMLRNGRPEHIDGFFQLSGDWTPLLSSIDASPVMREARQLYAASFDFRQIPLYSHYMRRMELQRPVLRSHILLDNQEVIDAYFSRYVELFHSIETKGLQHRQLNDCTRVQRAGLTRWGQYLAEWNEREIGVAINADGSFIRLPGGQHRTAIATVLGLPVLPVQVRLVHADWMAVQPEKSPWQAIRRALSEAKVVP